MLIIWGTPVRQRLEAEVDVKACPLCTFFTLGNSFMAKMVYLIFYPFFPSYDRNYYLICTSCENSFRIKDEDDVHYYLRRGQVKVHKKKAAMMNQQC